jgi:hypothetical protein
VNTTPKPSATKNSKGELFPEGLFGAPVPLAELVGNVDDVVGATVADVDAILSVSVSLSLELCVNYIQKEIRKVDFISFMFIFGNSVVQPDGSNGGGQRAVAMLLGTLCTDCAFQIV